MLYTFKYLRADGEEVEQKPFLTKKEANRARDTMRGAGAMVTEVYPTNGDSEQVEILKAKKNGLVAGEIKSFEVYLRKELDVLDADIGYEIVYGYIEELERRVKRYIKSHNPTPSKKAKSKGMPDDLIKKFARYGKAYLKGVARVLKERSGYYSPIDGSVPESIGELLKKLSREFF